MLCLTERDLSMRVLFFIEPLIMHNRPFHYWAWLDYSAKMYRALSASQPSYDFRFLTNDALTLRATAPYEPEPKMLPRRGQGLPANIVLGMQQEVIREIFNASNVAILEGFHREEWPADQINRYGELIRARLDGFIPDIIITRTPVPFLSVAYPDAMVLGTECGPFSRSPYPLTTFLDPTGLWARSVPGACSAELLQRSATEAEKQFLGQIRDHYLPFFRATSPFHELESRLRKRHRRLALLPLQFSGESGFELNSPFRNQGEFLFHVLERLPEGLGLLVVEHPTAHWIGDIIDEETREYVAKRFPQVTFVDWQSADSAGQVLIHHVDYVMSISSSLGLQALFWQKSLVAVGWSQLKPYATFAGVEQIDLSVDAGEGARFEGALAWLMSHYYSHEGYSLSDGDWLDRFFRTCKSRLAAGVSGLALHDPIAPLEDVARDLCSNLPETRERRDSLLAGLLKNGKFESWRGGVGPFMTRGATCDAWEIIPGEGNTVRVSREDFRTPGGNSRKKSRHCIRVERSKCGGTPSFLLQRMPQVSRCAGALVTVRFWARSRARDFIAVYLFQQMANPALTPRGSEARTFSLDPEWTQHEYSTRMPALGSDAPGAGNHTELVFCLPADAGAAEFDLAMVELS